MKTIRLILIVVILGIFMATDMLVRKGEHSEWWYSVPGLFALLGLLGCLAIAVVSKLLGHYWLQRREDYYGDDVADD
ncbi:MAG: hypothetical protein V1724_09315 [Chloroflexota bacterium]